MKSVIVFVDGACSGNPGPGGWGAIIVNQSSGMVKELGGRERSTTNNKMELTAAIQTLSLLNSGKSSGEGAVLIYTDSKYVINGITKWIYSWRRNNWKTAEGNEVANQPLWEQLSVLSLGAKMKIKWEYVPGHAGVPGNERVDEIAVAFSQGDEPNLYCGPITGYSIDYETVVSASGIKSNKPHKPTGPTTKQSGPFSYLSVIGSTLMRHKTWAECEQRVKGRSGAKFKKAMSSSEENEIIAAWGFRPEDLN